MYEVCDEWREEGRVGWWTHVHAPGVARVQQHAGEVEEDGGHVRLWCALDLIELR